MAEILFTCKISSDGKYETEIAEAGAKDGDHREVMEMDLNNDQNNIDNKYCSYEDVDALADEMEQESQFEEDILRIRKMIGNSEKESDESLLDSLRQLQLMPMSVETLKTTDIGKSVNALRKHRSKEIRNLVRSLLDDWRLMVDEWVKATKAIEGSAEPAKASSIEEEGLPSPPLDEGAFLANPVSMDLSQKFFDGIDDGGNPQKCGEFNMNRNNVRKRRPEKVEVNPKRDPNGLKRNQELVLRRQSPPSKPISSHERKLIRPKPVEHLKVKNEVMVQQKSDRGMIQKKPMMSHPEKVRTKPEPAKRKLQERNQEVDKAKKQRGLSYTWSTAKKQRVDKRNIPKHSLVRRNQLRS